MDRYQQLTEFAKQSGFKNVPDAFSQMGKEAFLKMERSTKVCTRENIVKYISTQNHVITIKQIEKAFGKDNLKSVQNNVLRAFLSGTIKRAKYKHYKYFYYGLPEWFIDGDLKSAHAPQQKIKYNPIYFKTILKTAA